MSVAVLRKVDTRRDVAERLMALNVKHAAVFAEIDDLKEKLKVYAETDGKGYTEEFGEGRNIKVSSPSESKFKGIMPTFDAAAFLDLPEKQREKLIDGKIVAMEKQFTQARRPSVSVEC
jgi:hypothetical protein